MKTFAAIVCALALKVVAAGVPSAIAHGTRVAMETGDRIAGERFGTVRSEQVGMETGARQFEDEDVFVDMVDEQICYRG